MEGLEGLDGSSAVAVEEGTVAGNGYCRATGCISPRRCGLLIALIGSLLDTPDAMLTRQIGEFQSNESTIFYKYLFVTIFTLSAALAFEGGIRPLVASVRAGPLHVLAGSVLQATTSASLTIAFLETEVAHALLAFSLFPLEAALFSRIILKESIPLGTAIALCASR